MKIVSVNVNLEAIVRFDKVEIYEDGRVFGQVTTTYKLNKNGLLEPDKKPRYVFLGERNEFVYNNQYDPTRRYKK